MKFYRDRLIPDVVLVVPEPIPDIRGTFARSFCNEELAAVGLINWYPQSNISTNKYKGTLRGLHYQLPPYAEAKLVSCVKGRIFDVAVDLRLNSETFTKWVGCYLGEEDDMAALYIPPGFAHGYITLTDNTSVFYRVSVPYTPNAEKGVMWNDTAFNIKWPLFDPIIISARDQSHSYVWEGINLE